MASKPVGIRHWVQETNESGGWRVTDRMTIAQASHAIQHCGYERAEIVEIEPCEYEDVCIVTGETCSFQGVPYPECFKPY